MNAQNIMEDVIRQEESAGRKPSLLLHCCCAPCSSSVMEQLSAHFHITAFYYNPNISPQEEYEKRISELDGLLKRAPFAEGISLLAGPYDPDTFRQAARGLETLPEGGERCFRCYELRLRMTAAAAAERGFDYFTTTLSVSPLKKAEKLNETGLRLAVEYKVPYLVSDFKKKDGYLRSITLSKEYGLYRQDYCGCIYSRQERDRRKSGSAE